MFILYGIFYLNKSKVHLTCVFKLLLDIAVFLYSICAFQNNDDCVQ